MSEQNNNKITQIEQPLNNKFVEILKEIRTNINCNIATGEEDVENRLPGLSNSKTKGLRSKHASNMTIEKDQDDRFYSSEMSELRQLYTPLGIAEDTLDETIITNENRQENADHHMVTGVGLADHHMVTGPTKNILGQSSNNTNKTNTLGRNAEHLFLKHPEPPDPVNQISQAIEKIARRNRKTSSSKDLK